MPTPSPVAADSPRTKGNEKRKNPRAKRDISMGFKKSGFSPAADAFGKENNSPQGRGALNKPRKAGGLSVVVSAAPTQLRKRQLAIEQPVKELPAEEQITAFNNPASPEAFATEFPLSPADSAVSDNKEGNWSWIDSPSNSEGSNKSGIQSFKEDQASETFMAGGVYLSFTRMPICRS
jgi:hypothetical protein